MAPGKSGVAGEDINCRCFLSYDVVQSAGSNVPNSKITSLAMTTNASSRSEAELTKRTEELEKDIAGYGLRKSRWSRKIRVDNSSEYPGYKDWNCDIVLWDTADDYVLIHELLHATSVSYFDSDTYTRYEAIEEGSVDFLAYLICQEKGYPVVPGYPEQVAILDALFVNGKLPLGDKMTFAKRLLSEPLPNRYQWLENQVLNALTEANVSVIDATEIMSFIANLEGAI